VTSFVHNSYHHPPNPKVSTTLLYQVAYPFGARVAKRKILNDMSTPSFTPNLCWRLNYYPRDKMLRAIIAQILWNHWEQ